MKIAISAQGKTLEDAVDPRFGRCSYFIFVDLETDQVEAVENEAVNFASGAGIKSATLVVDEGVEAVLTGQVGPKATRVLESGQIKVYGDVSGTVAEAIEGFKQGQYQPVTGPTAPAHAGL